jgi:AraC-like DNA-binding protein
VDDMTQECRISRRTFQREIKESSGMGATDILKILRSEI